jgi:hypothetical protein
MAKNSFVDSPVEMIGQPPKGNKGTGSGTYNGEDQAPFSSYRRTSSPDAVPEKIYDGNIPETGKDSTIMPNKLPKNLG